MHGTTKKIMRLANLKVGTKQYAAGEWLFTRLYLVMFVCIHSDWDTLSRFMAHGGGGCVLNIVLLLS